MRTVFTLGSIIIFSLIFSGMVLAATVGKITKIEGRVDITSPDQEARTANIGDELFQGDFVRTKSSSKAEILFSDGTTMRLAQGTRIEVSEYVVTQTKRSSIIKLFRGTVQSKVKKMFGRLFGSRSRNRYEIHTPTAVCGVRGTDYFSSYQAGASHFIFKEGSGYGYSVNKPDEVRLVNAGQIMSIAGASQSPLVRPASDTELQRLDQSTDVRDGQDDSGEPGEDGETDGMTGEQESGNGSGIEESGDDVEPDETRVEEGGERNDSEGEGLAENNKVDDSKETNENHEIATGEADQQGHNKDEAIPMEPDGDNNMPAEGPVGEAGPYGPSGADDSSSSEPIVDPLDKIGDSDPNLAPMDQNHESSNPIPLDNTVVAPDDSPLPFNNPDDTAYPMPDYSTQDVLLPMPTDPDDTFVSDNIFEPDILGPPDPDVYIPPEIDNFVEPFTIDNIFIAGTPDGYGGYPMSLSGTYAWLPPFIHMGGGVQGIIEPGSGALSEAFYTGFVGANFHDEYLGNTIKGGSLFLYMAQDGSAGVLSDDELLGDYDPTSGTWSAGTSLRPIQMAGSGSLSAPNMWGYELGLKYQEGGFYNTSGNITVEWSHGHLGGFAGQDWGLWRLEAGGHFTGPTDYDWHIDLWDMNNSFPNSFFRYMQINGREFLYGNLEGHIAGGWVNLNQVTTGILSGDMHGGFDPSNTDNKWFALSGGAWIETNKFLQMAQTAGGRNTLHDLDIPYIEVGRTDLTGNSGIMDVYMNNVTFFSFTSGGNPRIWATNSVSGYASTTPTIGHNVNLTGSGLNVDFTVQKWDNGVWGAELEGGGVYNNPAQSMHNKNILLKGGGTGQYQNDGSFSGTAAGNATPTY